ncbi:uncharacterized protein LOC124798905 [Schistocerca piceifrons]|uniref:uncharacterized protein LOC124798905 n=1 Tax=Schistocerca piceifrons TaxID=274613 RepID=UPI001F5EF164|nr:uncharacterized protein LOC124798905 [Schistocerca piceifrons]
MKSQAPTAAHFRLSSSCRCPAGEFVDTLYEAAPLPPDLPERISYFNNYKPPDEAILRRGGSSTFYDSVRKPKPGWDPKTPRCDRSNQQLARDEIWREEEHKPVPTISSLEYGRPCRPLLDERCSRYGRVEECKTFRSRRGINLEPDPGRPCEATKPPSAEL